MLFPFLSREDDKLAAITEDQEVENEGCNFEQFFSHERLPAKSDMSKESFMQTNFEDVDLQMKELIDKIADRDSKKIFNDKDIVV